MSRMRAWRYWPYLFPADTEVQAVFDVFERVDPQFASALDWTVTDDFVVVVADLKTAMFLRVAFDNLPLLGVGGVSLLDEDEVLIRRDQQAECEHLLRDACGAAGGWFSVISIHAETNEALQAFDVAYRAVVTDTPLRATSR